MYKILKFFGSLVMCLLFLVLTSDGDLTTWSFEKTVFAVTNADLISYWSFDEGSGSTAADTAAAGNSNDGTLINGPQWVKGLYSNALEFNPEASQYIQTLNNGDSLSIPSGGITITAWIDPNEGQMVIVAKDKVAVSARGNYFFAVMNGKLEFGFSPQPTGADVWIETSEQVIIPGKWSHVAVSFTYGTGEKPMIYVDGKSVAVGEWQGSGDQANAPFTYPDPLYIGRSIDSGWFFNGTMDEVKLYDRVLSSEEIESEVNFNYMPIIIRTN